MPDHMVQSSLGPRAEIADAAEHALAENNVVERLRAKDVTLWPGDEKTRAAIANRLGWLDVVESMRARVAELTAFAGEVRAAGMRHAVLLGMGGSSLAPEVLARTFDAAPGFLSLHVLDNTSPEAIRAVEDAVTLPRTLFLVSTKSGTTIETLSFWRYFDDALRGQGVARTGPHFVAITDAGTPLESDAQSAGFRRVFVNPSDIGGRYSALSYFGLVPAALLGIDLQRFLDDAAREAAVPEMSSARLGAVLGALGGAGQDKVTFVFPPAIRTFGAWAEQLIAESTGKNERGLVPIDDEPLGAVDAYGTDRVFAQLRVESAPDPVADAEMEALIAAGHTVLRRTVPDTYALASEFYRWEVATAVAGLVLEVNPFDEPNVTEAKDTTRAVLKDYARDGKLPQSAAVITHDGLEVHLDVETSTQLAGSIAERQWDRADVASWLAAFLGESRDGDYLALLAYMRQTAERDAAFADARRAARDRWHRATTLGYGPRYLHSTGQLHKGGPNTGLFVLLTAPGGDDLVIPGESAFTFGALRDAQALGDLLVLRRRGRRAMHVHCVDGADAGCAAFARAMERAANGYGQQP